MQFKTHDTQASYAHTKQSNVSPMRGHINGQSNIPMTYHGPPNAAEMNRNKGRKDYTRASFEFGYDHTPGQAHPAAR